MHSKSSLYLQNCKYRQNVSGIMRLSASNVNTDAAVQPIFYFAAFASCCIHTSMGNPTVCQCRNLCCPNSGQPSWCRTDTAHSCSHFSAIQSEAHIFPLSFARAQFPLHTNQQTLPAVMTCTSTFAHINQSAISRRRNKGVKFRSFSVRRV